MWKGRENLNENICLRKIEKNKIRSNSYYLNHDLKILCKKYKNVNDVVNWCIKNWDEYDKDLHYHRIKNLVESCNNPKSKDREIYIAPNVNITKNEFEKIKSLYDKENECNKENIELQKLAFMLLLLVKIIGKNVDGKYYMYENRFDYKKLSGLNHRSGKDFNKLMNKLHDKEFIYIDFIRNRNKSKMNNLITIEVKFVGEYEDDIKFCLNETDYLYPEYIFLKYFTKTRFVDCIECGFKIIAGNNKTKYCETCKKEIRLKQERERQRERRQLSKEYANRNMQKNYIGSR